MSEWLPVNMEDEFIVRSARTAQGVEINVFLSPHDVPERVRGFRDEARNTFVIEFAYIGDEPTKRVGQGGEPLTLKVGKNSGRLYAIEIDLDKIETDTVVLNACISEQVDRARDMLKNEARRDNYDLAKKVISARKDQLFKDLVPA